MGPLSSREASRGGRGAQRGRKTPDVKTKVSLAARSPPERPLHRSDVPAGVHAVHRPRAVRGSAAEAGATGSPSPLHPRALGGGGPGRVDRRRRETRRPKEVGHEAPGRQRPWNPPGSACRRRLCTPSPSPGPPGRWRPVALAPASRKRRVVSRDPCDGSDPGPPDQSGQRLRALTSCSHRARCVVVRRFSAAARPATPKLGGSVRYTHFFRS